MTKSCVKRPLVPPSFTSPSSGSLAVCKQRYMQTKLVLSPVQEVPNANVYNHLSSPEKRQKQLDDHTGLEACKKQFRLLLDSEINSKEQPASPKHVVPSPLRRVKSYDKSRDIVDKKLTKSKSCSNAQDPNSVRRSQRRVMQMMACDNQSKMVHNILNKVEEGMKVVEIEGKGRGVVSTQVFNKEDFIVEYAGELLDFKTAKKREEEYRATPETGCYMYYFCTKDVRYCLDATEETGRLGRLLNHSKMNPNCYTKVLHIRSRPYLCLFAKRDIEVGEELLYDYGDRDKETLEAHPWLKY